MSALVSVCVLAYNHEKFICQALDSILEQETNFSFEILMFEDASTDATLVKIKEYQSKFPYLIKVFSSSKNLGHFLNLRSKFKEAKGKYVCVLDGDDYWCSKHKLQKQVDFLEKNPFCVGVSHNVMMEAQDRKTTLSPRRREGWYDIYDVVSSRAYFHTSSLLHRNIFEGVFPAAYYSPQAGDWFLSMLYAERGPIYYFNDVMSVYRFHGDGLWSGMRGAERRKANIEAALEYDRLFGYKYTDYFIFSLGLKSLLLRHFFELKWSEILRYMRLLVYVDCRKLLIYWNFLRGRADKDMEVFLKRR